MMSRSLDEQKESKRREKRTSKNPGIGVYVRISARFHSVLLTYWLRCAPDNPCFFMSGTHLQVMNSCRFKRLQFDGH